jgi:hypothetical protein
MSDPVALIVKLDMNGAIYVLIMSAKIVPLTTVVYLAIVMRIRKTTWMCVNASTDLED